MAKKKGKKAFRHRLQIYRRLGRRWSTMAFLIVLLGVVLYGAGWLSSQGNMPVAANAALLSSLWEKRILTLGLIGFSFVLYVVLVIMARSSYVEVRPKALHIRAGLMPQDISYGRINKVIPVSLDSQYPADSLKRSDYAVIEPFYGQTCTAIELRSWPKTPLRKLWHKFMFMGQGNGLLLIIEDALVLNQQIDGALSARQARIKGRSGYRDPIERAVEQEKRSRL